MRPIAIRPPDVGHDAASIDGAWGTRVALVGTYHPVHVSMRPPRADAPKPHTVEIVTASKHRIMVELYYRPEGRRSDEEIAMFDGKRVRVVGVIHPAAPGQRSSSGELMATMTNPYIGAIESITLAPE